MKRVYLLRHAQSPSALGVADHERGLSEKGISDSLALGQVMAREHFVPDVVLCSSAKRTRLTLQHLSAGFGRDFKVTYTDDIYRGSMTDYLTLLQTCDAAAGAVLLVGHNPTIHSTAAHLAHDDGSASYNQLMMGYAPATLSVLDFACHNWRDLKAHSGQLLQLVTEKSY